MEKKVRSKEKVTPSSYLIIGCGHFGRLAVEKLLIKNPRSRIIAVEKNREAVKKLSRLPIETIVGNGLSYLNRFFSERRRVDYIIPAAPFHLAYEFILRRLKPYGVKRVKVPIVKGLPNPVLGKTGDLYTSLADFLCPEDCPGPSQYCTVTRRKREKPLYQILKDLKGPFESKVIISHQLSPGVGGFWLKTLLALSGEIGKRKNSRRLILISTSSRCHGVTSALSF
jgi:hypothetical protein